MDDLLSLLDGGEACSTNVKHSTSTKSKDGPKKSNEINKPATDFSSAFGGDHVSSSIIGSQKSTIRRRESHSTTLDEHSKLRIVNRVTSRLELNEKLNSHQFYDCTSLAAASKATLTRLLLKPSPSNELSGKTNLAAMAILFQNSGTKISGKGSAFAIFTLGDFKTGSLISLFLFGDAYSKFNSQRNKIHDGTVLTLLSPNLLPNKPGSETSISLSVSQKDQIVVVGKAQDYGKCMGTCRSKRNGAYTETRCRHYVDLRVSNYCTLHAKQRFGNLSKNTLSSSSRSNSNSKKPSDLSFVQRMKMNSNSKRMPHANQQLSMHTSQVNLSQKPNNDILFPNTCTPITPTIQRKAPLHMKKMSTSEKKAPNNKRRILSDFLNESTKQRSSTLSKRDETKKKQKRKIAHAEGFDGNVFIPKPSVLFQRAANAPGNRASNQSNSLMENPNETRERILSKQRMLIKSLTEKKAKSTSTAGAKLSKNPFQKNHNVKSKTDSLFDSLNLNSAKREKVVAASSKYSVEAKAELYAASRKKLLDLQRRESSQLSTKKNKEEKAIQVQYECLTCRKKFLKKPMYCIKSSHKIKLKRNISRSYATVREERMKKHDTSGSDGAMVLAAGLDWSRWKGT